jgi:hypothetical protein
MHRPEDKNERQKEREEEEAKYRTLNMRERGLERSGGGGIENVCPRGVRNG